MSAPLTFAQVAAEVGLSRDRFRRVWRNFIKQRGFPPPFSQPPGAHFKWNADEVAEWKRRRSRALGTDGRHEVANDVHPDDRLPFEPTIPIPAPNRALANQRAQMRALMSRGA
ncbi:hypothetical protein [Caulobacter sp. X]|uniref:hypothetical protein n=1 Tax=Caulobacter sp. X TaxID=2048901 RepID=UPI000C14B9FC|nr:hypothetical protein [Caulobacter sp. X]PIB96480.1 hypothetical protein CSW60_18400 [Caulobacter sp. X]